MGSHATSELSCRKQSGPPSRHFHVKKKTYYTYEHVTDITFEFEFRSMNRLLRVNVEIN